MRYWQITTAIPSLSLAMHADYCELGITAIQDLRDNRSLDCKASKEKLTSLHKLKGQTIYVFGDSTIRQQAEKLCDLILQPLERIEKYEENRPYVSKTPVPTKVLHMHAHLCENEHVRLVYGTKNGFDFRVPSILHIFRSELNKYDKETNQEHRTAPNIIYFNGGIHILYIPGFLNKSPAIIGDKLCGWRHAEIYVNQYIKEATSILAPGGRIVFMTSHFIDDSKRHESIASFFRRFNENPKKFAQPCIDFLEQKKEMLQLQNYNIAHVCVEAAQTSHGVKSLNDRVMGSIAATAEELGINIGCVDGYENTFGRANDTLDGVHYPSIARLELSSLVDAIG